MQVFCFFVTRIYIMVPTPLVKRATVGLSPTRIGTKIVAPTMAKRC